MKILHIEKGNSVKRVLDDEYSHSEEKDEIDCRKFCSVHGSFNYCRFKKLSRT